MKSENLSEMLDPRLDNYNIYDLTFINYLLNVTDDT